MYPRLQIDVDKIKNNIKILSELLRKNDLEMAMVTKSYCAIPKLVEELAKDNIDYIADSRVENLKNIAYINIPKILLRIPMISETKDVVKYCDISFNSEVDTIYELNRCAKELDIKHKVVLMIDLGDLREGFFYEYKQEIFKIVEDILSLENIKLYGLATNLTCYGAVIPTKENLQILVDLGKEIENKYGIKLDFISGGNSSSIDLLKSQDMPKGITNLRLGEVIILGKETAYGEYIEDAYSDAFKLICEVIEIKEKPSIPIGKIGVDAFGNKPYYEDKGIIKRAIVAIGKQDIDITSIIPLDNNIEILGASSDHMILNISNCKNDYNIGDKVEFKLQYAGVLVASTSKYVYKELIHR